jgi:phosphoribosylglycinamide formyltransferase-1
LADKVRIAVFISGAGTNMAALVYASRIGDCPYEVVLVASNDPAAPGLALAKAEGIATFALSHKGLTRAEHDAAMEAAVRQAGAEMIVLAGYMRILSEGFVSRWAGRILNIHPSLLPKYKGLNTHARAIAAGESHAGASVHLVTGELDSGPVLGQIAVPIIPGDTPESLAERVRIAEHQLYPRVVADYIRRWRDPGALLARVRALALTLPGAEARTSRGRMGFRVGGPKSGRFFAYFAERPYGSQHIALLVRAGSIDELNRLVAQQPEAYFKPSACGASAWIGIILDRPGLDWQATATWLTRSWQSVAPRRLRRLLNQAEPA